MINDVPTRFGATERGHLIRRGFTLVELMVSIGVIVLLIAMLIPAARRSVEAGHQVTCLNHLRQIAMATLMYCHENDEQLPGLPAIDPPDNPYPGPLPYEWIYAEGAWTAPFNDVTQSPILKYMAKQDPTVLRCPSDPIDSHMTASWHSEYGPYLYSYTINLWTAQRPPYWGRFDPSLKSKYNIWPANSISDVKNASQTIFFLEEDPRFIDDGAFWLLTFESPDPANPDPSTYEPPSYVHDIYREMRNRQSRSNVVFCDGHGDFVTQDFILDRAHYDPHY